ncbi:MAG: ABC transporter substrate-binding protein [Gemmataceae bacterium]
MYHRPLLLVFLLLVAVTLGCGSDDHQGTVITFPASAVGKEAEVLHQQIARFHEQHPDIHIELQYTPDASDQRHQLYVQWLNAHASDPDILQLDAIWTPEFAAAGWILPLDRFHVETDDFFKATVRANQWRGKLYALPWFVDVGMLYYRTDLTDGPPRTLADLTRLARADKPRTANPHYGFLWQGARYEGLICVFTEVIGGFGGQIMDDQGRIVVDSEAGVEALTFLRDSIYTTDISPESVLTWQEEQTRFGFQNGQSVYLRNWPYAYALMQDRKDSSVAGKFAVTVMPAAPGGEPTAALGGSQLAINAHTEHPEAAYRVIDFLTRPEQQLERAFVVGQFPSRRSIYDRPELAKALAVPPAEARRLIEHAAPRPVTPVYAQLSGILQIWLHRALTNQAEPRAALKNAAQEMRTLLRRVGLGEE